MCVRAIIVGGVDNVVNERNFLIEHLNVVVSTSTVRCALHEVGLGSLEKLQNNGCLWPRMCVASWTLLNIIIIGLSMIGMG